jgi:hypothetical protein
VIEHNDLPTHDGYCCDMRRHFLVGIVAERHDQPAPIECMDFVVTFEPRIVIAIKFCPFCGQRIDPKQQPLREQP